jgi:hypothetical protein
MGPDSVTSPQRRTPLGAGQPADNVAARRDWRAGSRPALGGAARVPCVPGGPQSWQRSYLGGLAGPWSKSLGSTRCVPGFTWAMVERVGGAG